MGEDDGVRALGAVGGVCERAYAERGVYDEWADFKCRARARGRQTRGATSGDTGRAKGWIRARVREYSEW